MNRRRPLRSGFTTGACAAAATKAAILCLDGRHCGPGPIEIPFPDGERREIFVSNAATEIIDGVPVGHASVIKDAGDDPDVTNGAEIIASVSINPVPLPPTGREREHAVTGKLAPVGFWLPPGEFVIKGGEGVGTVTKPGLAVPVGEPAINPVPQAMIINAAREALRSGRQLPSSATITITISVKNGEKIAQKTLNHRLGIVGGISILGTTGIVTPLSSESWKATISAGMDVAVATGCTDIVLSAGRASEKAHLHHYRLPEEAYVMMGDYFAFSVSEAVAHGFGRIHIAAQWAKMLKIAMTTPQTHVRHGALNPAQAAQFVKTLGGAIPDRPFNTARELYEAILQTKTDPDPLFRKICMSAAKYAASFAPGAKIQCHLVDYDGTISMSAPKLK